MVRKTHGLQAIIILCKISLFSLLNEKLYYYKKLIQLYANRDVVTICYIVYIPLLL